MASEVIADVETALAGAIAWWREAGVEYAYADEPTVWLSDPPEVEAISAPAQPIAPPKREVPSAEPIGGDRARWPTDLAAFQAWWLTEPSLDQGRVADRISPHGPSNAEIMVLVEQPEAQDRDTLLSGPHGAVVRAMLAAMEVAQESAIFAAVLVRHTPMPDWAALGAAGLGEVLAHHIRLAAPQRIIAFGSSIPPLLGNDLTQTGQSLLEFNHEGRTIPVLSARPLDALARPKAKAAFWQLWLDWTGTHWTGIHTA